MTEERRGLLASAGAALLIGCVGITFAWISGSQAILLDGAFNLTYFITALLTLKVVQLVARPDTEEFPLGYGYFEPLINGVKGLLILGISLLALFDAVGALLSGGRHIDIGPAIGYGVFATLACTVTSWFLRRAQRSSGSPLLAADAASWTVNAAISGAVLLAFLLVPIAEHLGWNEVVPYVDPFLVAFVVLISLSVPIRMGWTAVMELLNRAPPPGVRRQVVALVEKALADLPTRKIYVRIIQPGRTRLVAVHVVLPEDFPVPNLALFDTARARVQTALSENHANTIADVLFTADERLAQPTTPAAMTAAAVSTGSSESRE